MLQCSPLHFICSREQQSLALCKAFADLLSKLLHHPLQAELGLVLMHCVSMAEGRYFTAAL